MSARDAAPTAPRTPPAVPAHARALAARLAGLFETDSEIVATLNDAHHLLADVRLLDQDLVSAAPPVRGVGGGLLGFWGPGVPSPRARSAPGFLPGVLPGFRAKGPGPDRDLVLWLGSSPTYSVRLHGPRRL